MERRFSVAVAATVLSVSAVCAMNSGACAADAPADVQLRVATLAANVQLAEDLSQIEKLQRAYGYYVDKGMWEDLSELFTENAVDRKSVV